MKIKINIPDELAKRMAPFPAIDFLKIAAETIEKYVNENEPMLTFEEKEARAALEKWREIE